jgi:hypothetical protein
MINFETDIARTIAEGFLSSLKNGINFLNNT